MRRWLFLLFPLLTHPVQAQDLPPQTSWKDALEWSQLVKLDKDPVYLKDNSELCKKYRELLEKYRMEEVEVRMNPLLRHFVLELRLITQGVADPTIKETYTPPPPFVSRLKSSFLPGINWQASLINGLSNFMAGRFKQEALHLGLNRLFRTIRETGPTRIIPYAFPQTYAQAELLYGQGQNSYYNADLTYLQKTLQTDLEALPDNLVDKAPLLFPRLQQMPGGYDMFRTGYLLWKNGREGRPLPELLEELATSFPADNKTGRLFRLAHLFSTAFLDTAGSVRPWIQPGARYRPGIPAMQQPEILIHYGLLYEQLKRIPELGEMFNETGPQNLPETFIRAVEEMTVFSSRLNNIHRYLQSRSYKLEQTADQFQFLKETAGALVSIGQSKLAQTLSGLDSASLSLNSSFLRITEPLMRRDYVEGVSRLLIEMGRYMPEKYPRSLLLLAQFATVSSAPEMESLLNSYALPIGSASIKRRSRTNWSINSYVGFTAGRETAFGKESRQTKTNIGLSAPVGLSWSFRAGKQSFSLFASAIDLGSMVNARLGNDTTSYSNLRLEHFLAPGIGLFYNWKNTPLSLGLHYCFIPNLRTIRYQDNTATVTETNRNVTRLNFSLLVDIPLFNLYNKE